LLLKLIKDNEKKDWQTLTPMGITFLTINNQNWHTFGLGGFLLSELGSILKK
jgi:hypothetical protein